MKVTKEQNPHGVAKGQNWQVNDSRRLGVFTVVRVFIDDGEAVAEVYRESSGKNSIIRLRRFNKYIPLRN